MSMKNFIFGPIVAATAIAGGAPGSAQEMHGGHAMGAMGTQMQSDDSMGMDMGAGHDMGMMQTDDAMGAGHDMGKMQTDDAMGAPAGESGGAHGGHDMAAMQQMGNTAPKIHQLHISGQQHVLAYSATINALLVALDVDRDENLESLRRNRDLFQRMLTGLRHGDFAYGIIGFQDPQILADLAEVERVWSHFDGLVDGILDRSHVGPEDISALAAVNPMLHHALNRMVVTVEHQGKSFSILIPTVRQAGNLHIAMQELLVNYLLAVSGDNATMADVHRTAARFDRIMLAMVEGDSELQVLPAPNLELTSRYGRIDAKWRECWSGIMAMRWDDRASPEAIETLRMHVDDIAGQVVDVVALYHFL